MFCTKCGCELADDVRFCPKCGSPNARAAQAETAPQRREEPGLQVQPQPGSQPSQPGETDTPSAAPEPKRSKGRIAVLVVACMLAVVLAGMGLFFYAKANMGGVFGMTFVNATSFPDEGMRNAVSAQLDSDGDGILTADETAAVTRIELTGGAIVLGGADGNGKVAADTDGEDLAAAPGADAPEGSAAGESEAPGAGSGDEDTEGSTVGSLAGIENFPQLTTLNCRDAGLTELDLSRNPALEHVDCRGNSFATLDLSANSALTALLCDPEVEVTGLGQAGLYFTDLITGATVSRPGSSSGPSAYMISYDADGRPMTVDMEAGDYSSSTAYSYDEAGRLAEVGSGLYRFTYDDAGRLTHYACSEVGYGTSVEASYEYDEQGNLTKKNSSSSSSISKTTDTETTVYSFRDGALAESVVTGGRSTMGYSYTFDAAGRLSQRSGAGSATGGIPVSNANEIAYNEQGSCIRVSSTDTFQAARSSSTNVTTFATDYDGNGHPLRTLYSSGNESLNTVTIDYECNRDGYVTRASTSTDFGTYDFRNGQVIDVAYMKMVGSLEDRPARRFVPTYCFQTEGMASSRILSQYWFQGNGAGLGATVAETLPHQVVMRGLGIEVNAVSVPNEVLLAAYDREHGTMTVPVEATAASAPTSPAEGAAAQSEPVKIETEYFTAELPAEWADKVDVVYGTDHSPDAVTVNYKGFPEVNLLSFEVVDAAQPVVGGDIGTSNMWHADASDGKRVELWVGRYPIYFWSDVQNAEKYGNDSRLSGLSDAQKEEVLLLNTGQAIALFDVLAAKSEQEVSQNYALLVDAYVSQAIAPAITVR